MANKILKVHVSSLITARSLRRSPAESSENQLLLRFLIAFSRRLLGVGKNCSGFGIFTYFGLANKILKVHVSSLITARSLRRSPAAAILIILPERLWSPTVICAVSIVRTCPGHPSKHAWSTRGDTKQRKHSNQRRGSWAVDTSLAGIA